MHFILRLSFKQIVKNGNIKAQKSEALSSAYTV